MDPIISLLTPTALWVILAIAFGAWCIVSWMLAYHWRSYGKHVGAMKYTSIVYFVGSTLIFITLIILIITL